MTPLETLGRWLSRWTTPDDTYESRGVTLATLCDMVIGEYALDRSDAALIMAVRALIWERDDLARKLAEAQDGLAALRDVIRHGGPGRGE